MKIVGCFLHHGDEFVILKRHSHKPDGDTWGLPAGKVEAGETAVEAVRRELTEETGYAAAEAELEHLGDFTFGSGDRTYIFGTYRVRLPERHAVRIEPAAHSTYRWVTAGECYAIKELIPDFHELLERIGYVSK